MNLESALIAALVQAVLKWAGQRWLAIRVAGSGRELVPGADVGRTVGWFAAGRSMLLERRASDPAGVLAAIDAQLRRVPNYGYCYGLLIDLDGTRDVATKLPPYFPDVFLNYIGESSGEQATQSPLLIPASQGEFSAFDPASLRDHLFGLEGRGGL